MFFVRIAGTQVVKKDYAITFIARCTKGGLIKMPFSRHWIMHIEAMQRNIASALNLDLSRVNVKATTEEQLGFTGTGEGMRCHAVCLLEE